MRSANRTQDASTEAGPFSQILVGTPDGDWLVGTNEDDVITGGGGADALAGGAGRDTFVYLTASDSTASAYDNLYDFQTGSDFIDLSALNPSEVSIIRSGGSSFIFANSASGPLLITAAGRAVNGLDLIYNGPASLGVYMVGSPSADTLTGSGRNDGIMGGEGNDIITGGAGADALGGGAGADIFRYRAASDSTVSAYDNLFDFETGRDTIDFRLDAVTVGAISIIHEGGSSFLFADTSAGMMQITAAGKLIQGWDLSFSGASLTGGSSRGVTMIGSSANDRLSAAGNSTLSGGAGHDVISVMNGNNTLSGGVGGDTFYIFGQRSNVDTIVDFETGVDQIGYLEDATTGNATITRLENGDTQLIGWYSNSYGGAYSTILATSRDINGSDIMGVHNWSRAQITMNGSSRADTLIGASYNDAISGGGGDDVIIGGTGVDLLSGGEGADVFRYRSLAESTQTDADTIKDFVSGLDKIDLTAIGLSPSSRIGIGYMTGGSIIFVDSGGNGSIDMMIHLQNVTLQLSDIIWQGGTIAALPESLPIHDEEAVPAIVGADQFVTNNTGLSTSEDYNPDGSGPSLPWGDALTTTTLHHDTGWWLF